MAEARFADELIVGHALEEVDEPAVGLVHLP
jgi:hypothetical protein